MKNETERTSLPRGYSSSYGTSLFRNSQGKRETTAHGRLGNKQIRGVGGQQGCGFADAEGRQAKALSGGNGGGGRRDGCQDRRGKMPEWQREGFRKGENGGLPRFFRYGGQRGHGFGSDGGGTAEGEKAVPQQ